MSKLTVDIHTTKHNGRTNWSAYVVTNARHLDNPRPLMNGNSKGRTVVWDSFRAPDDNDTPVYAVAKALRKVAEFIENNVQFPEASEFAHRAHEIRIEFPLGEKLCECCGQGVGETIPEVYGERPK